MYNSPPPQAQIPPFLVDSTIKIVYAGLGTYTELLQMYDMALCQYISTLDSSLLQQSIYKFSVTFR